MSVSSTIDIRQMLYPNGRTGPMGEIGVWGVLDVVAGDATGGTSLIAATFRNVTNKLGVSISVLGLGTSSAVNEAVQVVFAHRMPGNESLAWMLETAAVGGPNVTDVRWRDSRHDPRTVWYPVNLTPPIAPPPQPNFSVAGGNVNGVTNTFRASGYLWPHMMLQQQVTRLPRILLGAGGRVPRE